MADRLSGDDVQIQIFVAGDRLINVRGRVAETSTFTDLIEVTATAHTGEKTERLRSRYRGGQFAITLHPERPIGPTWHKFLKQRAQGLVSGDVEIRMTGIYRNGEKETMSLLRCHVEDPGYSVPGQDLVTVPINGRCEETDHK